MITGLDELKGLDVSNLKLDPDFLKYLAEIIENQVKSKDGDKSTKPNKMDILVDVVKRLFPHADEHEIEVCKGIVEFLLKNTLIRKTSLSKIMSFYLKKKVLYVPLNNAYIKNMLTNLLMYASPKCCQYTTRKK
ncbi:MAG: hypothetical protein EOP00_16030 [Pedobacter sp.]|nr:MAG: hypothetical protein EOP00_16030 [Pedobacter sp.]